MQPARGASSSERGSGWVEATGAQQLGAQQRAVVVGEEEVSGVCGMGSRFPGRRLSCPPSCPQTPEPRGPYSASRSTATRVALASRDRSLDVRVRRAIGGSKGARRQSVTERA